MQAGAICFLNKPFDGEATDPVPGIGTGRRRYLRGVAVASPLSGEAGATSSERVLPSGSRGVVAMLARIGLLMGNLRFSSSVSRPPCHGHRQRQFAAH